MDAEIHFELTDALVREACMHHFFWRRWAWLRGITLFPVVIALLIVWRGRSTDVGVIVFLVLVAVSPLAVLFWCRACILRDLAFYRVLPHRAVTIIVTDAGLDIDSPLGHEQLPWGRIAALCRCPDMWLFVLRPGQFHILPTVALHGDLADFILARIRDHGGKTD